MNLCGVGILCAATAAWLALAEIQSPPAPVQAASPEHELMLDKLATVQNILRGLASEDFDLIRNRAEKLRVLSEHPAMIHSPKAAQFGPAFTRESKRLAEAARAESISACTDAFLALTRGCIDCHTAIRGKKASLPQVEERSASRQTGR